MEAKLIVVGGKANKREVKLNVPAVVGRSRDADLTVAHPTVSRRHCLIYEVDGALVVRDSGSLNGTVVEGRPIRHALLKPGETLTVGPLTFRAEYEHNGAFPEIEDEPAPGNLDDTVTTPAPVAAGAAATGTAAPQGDQWQLEESADGAASNNEADMDLMPEPEAAPGKSEPAAPREPAPAAAGGTEDYDLDDEVLGFISGDEPQHTNSAPKQPAAAQKSEQKQKTQGAGKTKSDDPELDDFFETLGLE